MIKDNRNNTISLFCYILFFFLISFTICLIVNRLIKSNSFWKSIYRVLGIEDESELTHLKGRIYDDRHLNMRGKMLRLVMIIDNKRKN